MQVEYEQILMV